MISRTYLPLLVTVALVVVASCFAYSGGIPHAVADHGLDKVVHAAMGFVLTALLARALSVRVPGAPRVVLAGAIVFVPVAADEYFQRYSSVRTSSWGDLIADIVGIGLAMWFVTRRSEPARRESA